MGHVFKNMLHTFFKKLSSLFLVHGIKLYELTWYICNIFKKKYNNNTKNVIHYAKRINIDSPSAVSGLW